MLPNARVFRKVLLALKLNDLDKKELINQWERERYGMTFDKEPSQMNFSERVRFERIMRVMSEKDLALEIGVAGAPVISRYENNGSFPSSKEVIAKYANVLGIPLVEFRDILDSARKEAVTIKGGIDLSGQKNLTVGNSGGIPMFNINPAQLARWQQALGVRFDIISIQPIKSLHSFLQI